MFVIIDQHGRYLNGNTTNALFVRSQTNAHKFPSEREAQDCIRKIFAKKKRKNYKVRQYFEPQAVTSQKQSNDSKSVLPVSTTICIDFEKIITEALTKSLDPAIEQYRIQLSTYDKMLSDIRHYIRDENTSLNACMGYKAFRSMQDLERKRADVKRELRRLTILKQNVEKAIEEAKEFKFEPYQNRVIEDVVGFITNGGKQT